MVFPRDGRDILSGIAPMARQRGWPIDQFQLLRGHLDDVFRAVTTGECDAGELPARALYIAARGRRVSTSQSRPNHSSARLRFEVLACQKDCRAEHQGPAEAIHETKGMRPDACRGPYR